MSGRFALGLMKWLLVVGVGVGAAALQAQTHGGVQVRGSMGSASYSAAGGTAGPLREGTILSVGSVIKTGQGAALDLSLGHNAGVVRLLQNSTLSLEHFNAAGAGPDAPVDIEFKLIEGAMLGFEQKLGRSSKYRVKVAKGIADLTGSKYRLDSQGYLVVLDGAALFAFVPTGGQPTPFQLTAPPAVYFSPIEGIRSAPSELAREVTLQCKGKLRGK